MWNRRIRVLFDLDDTLTDFIVELVDRYNKKYGTNHTKKDCYKWELNEIFEHNILELIDDEDFFESVKPKEGAIELMKMLVENDKVFEVYVITSCLKPENYIKKIKWFEKHMPFFPATNVVPLSDKHIVKGDILVDDRPKNIMDWEAENRNGIGILMDASHNQSCSYFLRIKKLEELESFLHDLAKKRNF